MEVELFETSHEDREATLPTGVSSLQHTHSLLNYDELRRGLCSMRGE
jgi:hypothetical protein